MKCQHSGMVALHARKWVLRSSETHGPDTFSMLTGAETGDNQYQVKAFNGYGDSAWSNWAEMTWREHGR